MAHKWDVGIARMHRRIFQRFFRSFLITDDSLAGIFPTLSHSRIEPMIVYAVKPKF